MAWSYESLVAARILQALGGGAIQPIGMAIVAELFEPHERGRALGIWGTGIMAGPALGPTLGGYLTDAFSWRTIFSVNLPVRGADPARRHDHHAAAARARGQTTLRCVRLLVPRHGPHRRPDRPVQRARKKGGSPTIFISARPSPSSAW